MTSRLSIARHTLLLATIPACFSAAASPANVGTYTDCTGFVTTDAGAQWRRFAIPNGGKLGCADPWTAILPTGTAITTTLGDSGIWIRRSIDGGITCDRRSADQRELRQGPRSQRLPGGSRGAHGCERGV